MIVLTGGAGFIGSAMLWELNREGIDDVIVVDDLEDAAAGKWKNLSGLRFRDIISIDGFHALLSDGNLPDIRAVIHMGAISATTETDADLLLERNYRYSRMIASFCAEKNIRFIYASSAATYGDGSRGYLDEEENLYSLRPMNMYGYSKQLFDLWALRQGVLENAAGLKFFNVYGPNEYHKGDMSSVVYKAFHQIRESGTVKLFRSHRDDFEDGGQLRDFIYVKDCTAAMLWLLEHPDVGGLFNIGTGTARTFSDLVRATYAAMDKEPAITYIPMPEHLRNTYQYFTQAETGKLKAYGYTPPTTSLEDGVRDYVCNYLMTDTPYFDHQSP
ncbi:ADP-glyceromanno-heptose 6-epimerase [Prosthecochloris sp. N3]|uniref:ADP-L-glycero-D-manno-heptose-6-epimerase n=1 Tax=Prosthecochloris ethylica TaxID=2743976 RepID=A0ABR9XQE4_9CHLB|nr:ADP-glyceromanno-heptose 6-epimerase [Prosthecochloris ethylica]MBF0585418.1 ADP-glyceromanno-heptose 6-epimerase [Prosthecochloris ethylica]MBF0636204.1 ADP-glyceromanno-heptose 6-epimerase [Prosthecochloris ethylica]MEC9487859.1 ADP-glyceromanno-heptose 6-epimerase [Prosthecochloris sp.]NUK46648.1 ADP-glyceromanno-heptose 6-epimerase [Prosthecochloris ethylica]